MFFESPEAIVLSRAHDGLIVQVNQEWLALTGYTREAVLGKTALEIGHWPDEQSRELGLYGLKSHGRLHDAELTLLMRDGSPRVVRLNAVLIEADAVVYILAHLRDITAERLAQEALKAGELALEHVNEKLNRQVKVYEMTESVAKVGHWVTYPGDAAVHLSHGYAEIARLGPLRTAPIGRHLDQVLEEDRDRVRAALQEMDGQVVEYRWRTPDGQAIWIRSKMQRHMDHGVLKAEFGIVQEITAEQEALQAVRAQLDFIQKITSRAPGVLYELQIWPDGRRKFPFISAAIEPLIGVSPKAVQEHASEFFKRVLSQDWPAMEEATRISARDLSLWQCEFRALAPDGSLRWLLGSAVPQRCDDGSVLWCGSVIDMTSHKDTLARLQESETRFRSLTELSSDWYWEQDAQFRFVRVDGSLVGSSNALREDYIGRKRWELNVLGVSDAQWAAHRAALQAHQTFRDFEMQRLGSDGTLRWASVSGTPIFDATGQFTGYRGTGSDITLRKKAEADIERLAFFDALTGLPNRRLLLDRLQKAVATSARRGTHGALLFIDLDNFKILNDTLGHHTGDELLKQVAVRLSECVRGIDTVARLGGDEFVVMLEELSKSDIEAAAQVEAVGKKVLLALNQHFHLEGQLHHSSPSIGVTLFYEHLHGVDELLKRADLAMYQAKAAGRNTLRFFDPVMQAAATARATLEADMRLGLMRQEFRLFYQPVVDEQRKIMGVEGLLRWQHPERGMVSPAEFIPVAEQTGLILPLGQWVLEVACSQLVAWSAQPSTRGLMVAVNVSARQFRHPEFSNQLLALLRSSGANPYRLKLEITESMLVSDMGDAIAKMSELRSIGVNFALDDFGTGYSSLSYLKLLPLDQLKIDQSFVRDVLKDPNDAAIVRTILNLAASLDLGVVAEGVETAGQHDFLLRNGCKAFQGYLFGRPVPVEQLPL
ncbi:MAG: EAL domain-containing protein [Rhodoferax sp.]|nr:EAL domain-containing protein [Rhodoferax sp.]MCF8207843.1 EAL domain-containing protein [Rhodoferax sp.]